MDYLEFYGLKRDPFSNTPVVNYYYESPQHKQALARLEHAAERMKGLALCVGDIGYGKTTLARRLLERLPEDKYEAALLVIIHAGISANWLLKRIALQLGVENPANEKLHLLSQLYRRLLQIREQGKKAVVLIDEAQMLATKEIMEEFRGLLNLEVPGHKLITFIFFGLPDIDRNLRLDPPLLQRVAMRYELRPFDRDTTIQYIQHRLRLSGASAPIFTAEALRAIHGYAKGVPRLINTVCDNALFEGFASRKKNIDVDIIAAVANELGIVETDEDKVLDDIMPPENYKESIKRLSMEIDSAMGPRGEDVESNISKGDESVENVAGEEEIFERRHDIEDDDIDRILRGLEDGF